MIYKNPKWGSTDFVDAIYINKKFVSKYFKEIINENLEKLKRKLIYS